VVAQVVAKIIIGSSSGIVFAQILSKGGRDGIEWLLFIFNILRVCEYSIKIM
jgi:hypothetical protein